jgi:error-prone DNA polymerase
VPLFQEQLIRMAMVAAGFTGGQAEELRRAMGFKRSVERMHEIEKDLRAGMARNGIAPAQQEEIVLGIKSFALYGFPESHAASFALIAYASAYLKAHHGAAFLCALLNNWPMGFYLPATLVTDAGRHGIRTLPVDATASQWECTLEALGGSLAVRMGLKYVAGLHQAVGRRIVEQRPFSSLADLHARIEPSAAEMAALANVGALAALGGTRREALWQAEALGRSGKLFARVPPTGGSPLPPMSEREEMVAELRGTNVTTGPHPVAYLRASLDRLGILSAAALAGSQDGARVKVGGVVVVRQRPGTAKGFVFVTIEDETGFANAIVTPDLFAEWRPVILRNAALVIEGKVQNRDGVILIKADRFAALPGRPVEEDMSRDFH